MEFAGLLGGNGMLAISCPIFQYFDSGIPQPYGAISANIYGIMADNEF